MNNKLVNLLTTTTTILGFAFCALANTDKNNNKIYTGVWHSLNTVIKDGIHIDSSLNCDLKFDGVWYIKAHKPQICTIFYCHNNTVRHSSKLMIEAIECPEPELDILCVTDSFDRVKNPAQWFFRALPSKSSVSGLLPFSPKAMQYSVIWGYAEILNPNDEAIFGDFIEDSIPGAKFDVELSKFAKPGNKLIFSEIVIILPDNRSKTFPDVTLHYREGYGFCK